MCTATVEAPPSLEHRHACLLCDTQLAQLADDVERHSKVIARQGVFLLVVACIALPLLSARVDDLAGRIDWSRP